MIRILPIPVHSDVQSGVTMVDTSVLPWPGATFSQGASATPEQVELSYRHVAETLGVERSQIRGVRQVHGCRVEVQPTLPEPEADALITDRPGEVIGVKIADCLGILLYDPEHRVIAAIHSGWRGTAQNIVGATIQALNAGWGSNAARIWAGLSPAASGRNYQVGADVHDALQPWCRPDPERSDRWYFDNPRAVTDQLIEAGVPRHQISESAICTMEDERFHSYRRDRERSGRCLAFITLGEPRGLETANP